MTTKVLLVLFDHVDLLDVGGPYEVFLTANRLSERDGGAAPFSVDTASADGQPVTAYGGLVLTPSLGSVDPAFDVVIVPGAVDVDAVTNNVEVIEFISAQLDAAQLKATVCTGSLVIGRAGALAGREWTTHFEDVEPVGAAFGKPGTTGRRWVDDGDLVTAGGLSSGIAMALHLVGRLVNLDLAQRTAAQIEYDWDPSGVR